jgi:predicted aspartyl protease
MRCLALLLLLLVFCGSVRTPAYAQCQTRPVAVFQLQTEGVPIIPVVLENRTALMMVDTGADTTSITVRAAQLLNLPIDPRHSSVIGTVADQRVFPNVLLNHLRAGPLDFGPQSLTAMNSGGPSTVAGQLVAGLIGMNLFGSFDIELSIAGHVLALYPPAVCTPAEPPWPRGTYETLEVQSTAHGRILVPVLLNGRRLMAVLDTGADSQVMTRDAAASVGASTVQIDTGQVSHGIAADAKVFTSRTLRFDTFSVGGELYRDVIFPIVDSDLGADMLLGDNWMRSHRLFMSAASHRLFVQRNDGEPITPLVIAPDAPRVAPRVAPERVASAAPVPPNRVGAAHCAAPVNLLPILSSEPLEAISRPRLPVPQTVQAHLTEGCAGAAFRVADDGTVHDIQVLTEWPPGYGLGDYIRQELEATHFQPHAHGMQALHYESHNLHPSIAHQ